MANYRPRSLDELGNLYDKSLEAENEIKKSSSKLEDKPVVAESAFLPEENMISAKKTPEQIASEEIADRIGDFAKSFGEDSVKHQPPVFIPTVQSRPKPPKKKPEEAEKKAPPKLIRNPERNSLFENYKKVMDDEDDDISAEEELPKRRLWRSKSSAPDAQQNQQNQEDAALMAEKAVAETFGTQGEKPQQPELSFKKISYQEYKGDSGKKAPEQTEEEPEEKRATGRQVFLMSLLLVVLMLATAVGCLKAFSGLNDDKPLFGEYQLYTSKRSYSEFNIGKNDLIVAQNESLIEGDIVVYKENEGNYSLAKYEAALNEESVVAVKGGEQIPVFYNDMRGVVTKTVPVLGLIVSISVSYFLPVMGLLLLLAALLILLVFFATRSPEEEEEDDEEDTSEETASENEEDLEEDSEQEAIDDEIENLFSV